MRFEAGGMRCGSMARMQGLWSMLQLKALAGQRQLQCLGLLDGDGVAEQMDLFIGRQEGRPVAQSETLVAQGVFGPQAVGAQGSFIHQL